MKITTDEFLLRIKIEGVLEKHEVKNYIEIAEDIAKIFLQPNAIKLDCEHKSITGGGLLNGNKKYCLDCGEEQVDH